MGYIKLPVLCLVEYKIICYIYYLGLEFDYRIILVRLPYNYIIW